MGQDHLFRGRWGEALEQVLRDPASVNPAKGLGK
jgi:hypothetical protein